MKAISLKQPYANLIRDGIKTIETRKWKTNYRGDLLICSSQNPKIEPAGFALCIVNLYDIRRMKKSDEKAACFKYSPKLYAWLIRNLRVIKPFPVKGQLNIYEVDNHSKSA
ncbi:MAG TPA: ASCH domain-containing protein [Patescibacteria group bacterium]|nr:ASCH domain-containing protein [Patescibacteria group bacterium]